MRALDLPSRLIDLAYAPSLPVPDVFGAATLRQLDASARAALRPPWPAVVVAAGRRTAPVARWIKRASGGATFAVQLMRPGSLRGLDLVAIPLHDRPAAAANVVATLGAPHPFDRATLDAARAELPAPAAALPGPRVTVLVGGPSGGVRFATDDVTRFVTALDRLSSSLGACLLVTTSRRTPEPLARALETGLQAPRFVHRFGAPGANPFRALLGVADRVVVTADSASMLSEACATGRPVHAFRPTGLPVKLDRLVVALEAAGHVRPWATDVAPPPAALDEAKRLARIIRERSTLSLARHTH